MSQALSNSQVNEICNLIEETSMTPQQACDRLGIDWLEAKAEIEDRDTEAAKKITRAKAKAIEYWQKKLSKNDVTSGEYKAARIQLQALDPERYLKKKDEGDTFSVTVKTVDASHLPKMPVENMFSEEEEE